MDGNDDKTSWAKKAGDREGDEEGGSGKGEETAKSMEFHRKVLEARIAEGG